MSRRKLSILRASAVFGVAVVAAVLTLTMIQARRDEASAPVREVVLLAKGTAFGDGNPTLEIRVGERLRVIVKNVDPGVVHAISVPGLAPTVQNIAAGEVAIVEVTPTAPGTYEYVCPLHCPLMKGKLVVSR